MRSSLLAAVPVALFWAATAFAAPATEAEAARLKALFQTYIGTTEGVLSVRPAADAYEATLDLTPFARALPTGSFAATPLVMRLTDQGDGSWAVALDQGIAAALSAPEQSGIALTIDKLQFSGVFDTKLQAFRQSSADFAGLDLQETETDLQGTVTRRHATAANGTSEATAVAASSGAGVDITIVSSVTGWRDQSTITTPEGVLEPGGDVTLAFGTYDTNTRLTGLRTEALYRILAFFVANPSIPALQARQVELRALLQTGLPLFETLTDKGTMRNMALETLFGPITISEVGIDAQMGGLVRDWFIRQKMVASGWSVPESLAPAWAQSLVPDTLAVGLKMAGFDLETALLQSVDELAPADPDALGSASDRIMAALAPNGMFVTFAPGHLRGEIYDLEFEGGLVVDLGDDMQGTARVEARGLTAIREAVGKAPPEVRRGILPVIAIVQAMAVDGPEGALLWEIDLSQGSLLVNGKPVPGSGP